MRKLLVAAFVFMTTTAALAQTDTTVHHKKDTVAAAAKPVKKDWSKVLLGNRPNDHLMIQFAYDNWVGTPDTIRTTGFSRSFNMYFMFDFPFKSDPRWSVGAGLGIAWSNIFFDKQQVLVASLNPTLAFPNNAGGDHFKKYKLVTSYLQIPIELRYSFDPVNPNRSWKIAVGVKVGTMTTAYTKAKQLTNNAGQPINNYIEKEVSKRFFNTTELVGTARVSYGVFGIFAQYQLTPLIKSNAGPNINPFAIGIQLSGL